MGPENEVLVDQLQNESSTSSCSDKMDVCQNGSESTFCCYQLSDQFYGNGHCNEAENDNDERYIGKLDNFSHNNNNNNSSRSSYNNTVGNHHWSSNLLNSNNKYASDHQTNRDQCSPAASAYHNNLENNFHCPNSSISKKSMMIDSTTANRLSSSTKQLNGFGIKTVLNGDNDHIVEQLSNNSSTSTTNLNGTMKWHYNKTNSNGAIKPVSHCQLGDSNSNGVVVANHAAQCLTATNKRQTSLSTNNLTTTIANAVPSVRSSSLAQSGVPSSKSTIPITTAKQGSSHHQHRLYEDPPYHIALLCYLSYAVLIIFGYLRDFMRKTGLEKNLAAVETNREGYPQLYKSFESFYTRNIYRRIRDAWNRPISSVPGAYIDIVDRVSSDYNWSFQYPGTCNRVVNMGSYNYLGFAENSGPIHETILKTVKQNSVGVCSVRNELGTSKVIQELENIMTRFLGVESCSVFGMGFATNSTNIQCLASKGCLIISDEMNHASLILGCRLSGATIRIFKHNDMKDLERKVRKYIVEGQPKTHRPWKKIIILVEGIYSMEGTIVNLPELIRIKRRYKCYVYLDEAHSIGALGPHGKGVVDYYNCDPNDIDILMGTFTKSFGAAGGYIAGRKDIVDTIRLNSFSNSYANPMSAAIAQQIVCVVKTLLGDDGTNEGAKRTELLARNARYFRRKLLQMGFIVYGHNDSPVVPLLICFCPKITAVIRMAYEKGLGFIGAGFPATALTTGRVRFCISASHTKEMLDRSLDVINEIGDKLEIKYSKQPRDTSLIVY